ncbi:MAG TPA: hypothetical protein VMH28_15655 [Candidatus Acidoferrales bacterium]|nr:hypothetical protein [Candidatus Acidoferrales bacterium]
MRRSAHSRGARVLLLLLPLLALAQPLGLHRKGELWEKDFYGVAPLTRRIRVNAHGPVTLQAGTSANISYNVRVSVRARTETEARSVMQRYMIRAERVGDTTTITAPGGPVVSTVVVKTPRIDTAIVTTSDGAVEASGIDGTLVVDTGGGELVIDRIRGDCKLNTSAGDIRVGSIGGGLRCTTGAGKITAGTVRGEAVMETVGGDIAATEIKGTVRAQTGGGGIHIVRAGSAVNASTVGGPIVVEHAGGLVIARNMAGPVQVGAAGGLQCESGSGGVRVTNIAGPMRVSTSLGNIMATLVGGKLADSYLATANGDITVLIPSNVGVNIHAQNALADTMRRILTEYNSVTVRRQGRQLIAEGQVNGGGPLLQISAIAGTIFIRKQ